MLLFIKQKIKYLYLAAAYVVLSLIIGEVHPFTTVPMYNSFPNWAYSFYISDTSGKLIPIGNYYSCDYDYLSHLYSTLCQENHIEMGNEVEKADELTFIGNKMFDGLSGYRKKTLPQGKIQLHRVCYSYKNNAINKADIVIYEQ